MPIYEYKCPKCGREAEMIVTFSQADKSVECPDCSHTMDKQLSKPAKGHIKGYCYENNER